MVISRFIFGNYLQRGEMNTRDLMMGLSPTKEFRKQHAYSTLKYFPELKTSLKDLEEVLPPSSHSIPIDNNFDMSDSSTSIHKSLAASSRMSKISKLTRSTKVLDDLKKSSVGEINALGDFMKQLVESRRAKKDADRAASASPRLSDSRAASASASAIEQGDMITSIPAPGRREEDQLNSDPLQRGNSRLAKIAVSYDFQSINSPLSGFEGAILNKKEFHSMLRQCLSVNLSREELDAVFQKIDDNGNNVVDGVEFVRYFFQLGNEEREAQRMVLLRSQERRRRQVQREQEEVLRRRKAFERQQSISEFAEKDALAAMQKLADAAFRWDQTNYTGASSVFGFEAFLTPYDFKQQLEVSFGVRLSAAEVGALLQEFATRKGEHCVDGYLFVKRFSALQKKVRADFTSSRLIYKEKKDALMAKCKVELFPKFLGR